MSTSEPEIKSIFLTAVENYPPDQWPAFLDLACGQDRVLRQRVEELLQAHRGADSLLDAAAPDEAVPTDHFADPDEKGREIGPYRLLQKIGEGGMGVVYMAAQRQPVQRKVAVKLIKPGFDNQQVIARLEAERQALALMDHPNIAKVLDAGTTPSGQPYFAMELVNGMPLTTFCDQRRLTPRERLELFIPVCQAVQHAHQKGVIHRDLKPSNVLVALYDGNPVPKVIDFGVAKAVGPKLTDKTMFTEFGSIVGTLEYMSPEQAEQNQLDVDTRSDIYSLGVLLYELLTGTTPLDKSSLKSAAILELLRVVREEDPPKPSTRLSTTNELPSIAANRKLEPKKLSVMVRGELDWIVMKALEKDRNRRYETAVGFGLDIQRYLSNEPVLACPPSIAYRFRKLIRRNKGPVAAAALVLLALLLGIIGTTAGLLQVRAERDNVTAAKNQEQEARSDAERNLQTARDAVDRMYTQVADKLRDQPQLEQFRRSVLEDALKFYRGFVQQKGDDPVVSFEAALSELRVAEIYGELGKWNEALEHGRSVQKSLDALAPHFGDDANFRNAQARAAFDSAVALLTLQQLDDGTTQMQRAIALWDQLAKEFPEQPQYIEDLVRANFTVGRAWHWNYFSKGFAMETRGQELLTDLRSRFPNYVVSPGFQRDLRNLNLSRFSDLPHDRVVLEQLERDCRAEMSAAEAAAAAHPDVPIYLYEAVDWSGWLGNVLAAQDKFDELEQTIPRALESRRKLTERFPEVAEYRKDLAWSHYHAGMFYEYRERSNEALPHFRSAIALARELVARYPQSPRFHVHLVGILEHCPVPELRDPQELFKIIERSRELGLELIGELAIVQVEAGQFQMALETCQKAEVSGKADRLLLEPKALALWGLGRADEARTVARELFGYCQQEPNRLWYTFEYRVLARNTARLMGLDLKNLIAGQPQGARDAQLTDLERRLAALPPTDARAVPLLEQLWQRQRAILGIQHADTIDTMRRLGQLAHRLREHKQLPDAERAFRQALIAYQAAVAETIKKPRPELLAEMQQLRKDLVNLLRSNRQVDEAKASAQEAEVFWDELAKDNPESADAALGSAQSHELAGNDPGALDVYSEGIKKWPQNPNIWLARGRIQMKRREYDQALSDLSKALEIAPTDGAAPWWHLDRATVLGAMGRRSDALNELTSATQKWPQLFDTWIWRGNWYLQQREWNLAAADYSRAAELNPSYVQVWISRAFVFARLKRWKDSQSDYETALRLDAMNTRIQNDLAWHLVTVPEVSLRNPVRAVELAGEAVRREPGQGSLWNTLGVAQYRAGNWPAAIESLEKSNTLLKGNQLSFNAFFLAMANWQLGQKEKAGEWFKKAMDWMAEKAPDNEELLVFRVEAAALLGVAEVRNVPVEAQRPSMSSP